MEEKTSPLPELTEAERELFRQNASKLKKVTHRLVDSDFENGTLKFEGSENPDIAKEKTSVRGLTSVKLNYNRKNGQFSLDTSEDWKLLSLALNYCEYLPEGSQLVFCVGTVMQAINMAFETMVTPPNSLSGTEADSSDEEDNNSVSTKKTPILVKGYDYGKMLASDEKTTFEGLVDKLTEQARQLGKQWEQNPVFLLCKKILEHKKIKVSVDFFNNYIDGANDFVEHLKLVSEIRKTDEELKELNKENKNYKRTYDYDDNFRGKFLESVTKGVELFRKKQLSPFRGYLAQYGSERFLSEEFAAWSKMCQLRALNLKARQKSGCTEKDLEGLLDFSIASYPTGRLLDFPHAYLFTSIAKIHLDNVGISLSDRQLKFMSIKFDKKLGKNGPEVLKKLGLFKAISRTPVIPINDHSREKKGSLEPSLKRSEPNSPTDGIDYNKLDNDQLELAQDYLDAKEEASHVRFIRSIRGKSPDRDPRFSQRSQNLTGSTVVSDI